MHALFGKRAHLLDAIADKNAGGHSAPPDVDERSDERARACGSQIALP
jgi:hypothetical protein